MYGRLVSSATHVQVDRFRVNVSTDIVLCASPLRLLYSVLSYLSETKDGSSSSNVLDSLSTSLSEPSSVRFVAQIL